MSEIMTNFAVALENIRKERNSYMINKTYEGKIRFANVMIGFMGDMLAGVDELLKENQEQKMMIATLEEAVTNGTVDATPKPATKKRGVENRQRKD
jgi:hypothetical protein